MQTIGEQLAAESGLTQMLLPDLWQQQAVNALRQGRDVVVQAPTGSGKTLIFELWANHGHPRGKAIYTVPTRALANDKLAEWRARGWNVGIATGDLSDNLEAPILVATLETQKHRIIRGYGPSLLVIDEYQMIADPDRGLNYELAIALAPPHTRLLLLSGSVANPHDVVAWLQRLGRDAVLVKHDERPVPLYEVHADSLSFRAPPRVRGAWPRLVARALAEGLGPILIFAPRRQAAETLATELARQLPTPVPLTLTSRQRALVGSHLAKLLAARIAYHHSGLSYAARAGVIEPLAKAGQLRVVVATMGLAAGINFSLRTVALAGTSYRRDEAEHALRPDEILQMYGRAGRRGIDEAGFALIPRGGIRLMEGHPVHLSRNGLVDWAALLGLMWSASEEGMAPFEAAVRAQERLFTSRPIHLGIEESLRAPDRPCGLETDAERARRVRRKERLMLNSAGEWQELPRSTVVPAGEVWIGARTNGHEGPLRLRPVLSEPAALAKLGSHGRIVPLERQEGHQLHGRAVVVAERTPDGKLILAKWIRRLTGWHGRSASWRQWEQHLLPLVRRELARCQTPLYDQNLTPSKLLLLLRLDQLPMRVPVDHHGVPLWQPCQRSIPPPCCEGCDRRDRCLELSPQTGTALLWKRLGLVSADGIPTRRGRIVSFFSGGNGLAIAAALEDESYDLGELLYDLACLNAGFRFAGDENRWAGRLALACHQAFGYRNIPGYLENGLPLDYGAGAEEVVAAVHRDPASKHEWVSDKLGIGDIDRTIIEWRSLLRQIAHAPELEWDRWRELRERAGRVLNETESPTVTDLPPLEHEQRQRVDHTLRLDGGMGRRWRG